jgi:hypothetical protein
VQAARPGTHEAKSRGFGYGFVVVVYISKSVSRLRRAAGIAIVAACMAATLGAATPGHPAAVADTVISGPARSLGEPAAAQDSAVTAVVATSFGSAGAQVRAWTKPARAASWSAAGMILPAGFGSSYDASAAAVPGGPLLLVAGTAPGGQACIAGGSVAIANVYPGGRLGAVRLVSDQRGTGDFDDRPAVAVGSDGTVWVAWSQGPDADACQNVGTGDRLEMAASHDGGRTFGAPVSMPAEGGDSAFGARLQPLAGGRVAVSWTETMSSGDEAVLVSVVSSAGQLAQPQQVLTGDQLPLALPGASFYDFPAGDITALADGRLVVAAPFWRSDHGVIKLAVGTPGGRWRASVIAPPGGADLLLPALGPLSPTAVRLVCAVHARVGDRLGYDWADLSLDQAGHATVAGSLAPLTSAPAGPGFFELGEELSISRTPGGLLSSVVVAGQDGASLETRSWAVPRPAAAPSARRSAARAPGAPAVRAGAARSAASPARTVAWAVAAIVVVACLALLIAWAARRPRRARHG